jgi:hypothetical protein
MSIKTRLKKLEEKLSLRERENTEEKPPWQKRWEKLDRVLKKQERGEELLQEELEFLDRAHERAFKIIKILLDVGVGEIFTEEGRISIEHLKGIEKKEELPFVII